MAKEAISEVPIPLSYALNLIYDTTRLAILCSKAKEGICIETLLMVPQVGT